MLLNTAYTTTQLLMQHQNHLNHLYRTPHAVNRMPCPVYHILLSRISHKRISYTISNDTTNIQQSSDPMILDNQPTTRRHVNLYSRFEIRDSRFEILDLQSTSSTPILHSKLDFKILFFFLGMFIQNIHSKIKNLYSRFKIDNQISNL